MSREVVLVRKEITELEDGYSVTWDFGEDGGGVDKVCIPPYDPQEAVRNRAQLNRVLARYGYRLKESGETKKIPPAQAENTTKEEWMQWHQWALICTLCAAVGPV